MAATADSPNKVSASIQLCAFLASNVRDRASLRNHRRRTRRDHVLAWVDAFYGRDEAAPTAASSWSEWPQTIFAGQMSSSLDAKTSRTVETSIHGAMQAAMRRSKIEYPVRLTRRPAATGAKDTYTSPIL